MKKHAKKLVIALLTIAMIIPTIAMIYSSAAQTYPVELAFNNLFIFEKWANNDLSSTLIKDGTPISGEKESEGGTLDIDITNGTFTMTKTDMSIKELYTAFSNSDKDGTQNAGYYEIDVKADTNYEFTFNLSGTSKAFVPYVFFFDSSNKCTCKRYRCYRLCKTHRNNTSCKRHCLRFS